MKKIVSIVGARPNFVKLWPIHNKIEEMSKDKFKHYIIHTGQHYDYVMSEIFFKDFKLPKPNFYLNVGSLTPSLQIAEMIRKLEKIFLDYKFDLVIVYGDTNSTFAGSFAAKQHNLKVAHIESGLRSYDMKMPEEINRILTDHISDYHYAPTKNTVRNLKKENIKNSIYSGDLSVEILETVKKRTKDLSILKNFGLLPKKYVLCTLHRAENTNFINLKILINAFEDLNQVIIFPIHPRTLKVLNESNLFKELKNCKNVIITEPLRYIDIINLIQNASKVITDSGGIQKESYLLQTPCITVRNSTEWIETLLGGWNILTGMNKLNIIKAIDKKYPRKNTEKNKFGNGKTSQIIYNHIKSILE